MKTDNLTDTADALSTDRSSQAMESLVTPRRIWDRLGILGSALCILHCLALPFLVGTISLGALGFLADEIFHKILALILFGVALFAFLPGYRHHRNSLVLIAGLMGVLLLLIAGFLLDHRVSHAFEIGLTIAASLILIGAHLANWRLGATRASSCCDD